MIAEKSPSNQKVLETSKYKEWRPVEKNKNEKLLPRQNGTQAMDIHLISTFTRLQLFICQIHHLQAKRTSVVSGAAHGDSTLKKQENWKGKKTYLSRK